MSDVHETTHHMKITAGGQISVPAAVRRRWGTTRVKVTDAGDHLVHEPGADEVTDLLGAHASGISAVNVAEVVDRLTRFGGLPSTGSPARSTS